MPGWTGPVKLQVPPAEFTEDSSLAIRLLQEHSLKELWTNGNSCLEIDFIKNSGLGQSRRKKVMGFTECNLILIFLVVGTFTIHREK